MTLLAPATPACAFKTRTEVQWRPLDKLNSP